MAWQQRLRVTGANIGRVMREHVKIIEALKQRRGRLGRCGQRSYRSLDGVALGFEEEADVRLSRSVPAAQEI